MSADHIITLIVPLLQCAVMHGDVRTVVRNDGSSGWVEKCTKLLTNCFDNQGAICSVVLEALGIRADFCWSAAEAITGIFRLAVDAGANDCGVRYVVEGLQPFADANKWAAMAERMMFVIWMWRNKRAVTSAPDRHLFAFFATDEKHKRLVTDLSLSFRLNLYGMPAIPARSAATFAVVYTHNERTYHGLAFSATPSAVTKLLVQSPEGHTPRSHGVKMFKVTMPKHLAAALERTPPVDVIALSGECGGGKTLCAMLAASKNGIALYALGSELDLCSLEERLSLCDPASHAELVADHLLEQFQSDAYDWTPEHATERNVCLVIDEVGPYKRCARAMCKLQSRKADMISGGCDAPPRKIRGAETLQSGSNGGGRLIRVPVTASTPTHRTEVHVCNDDDAPLTTNQESEPSNTLLQRFRTHFKTTGRVILFVVGCGVESALKRVEGDPMPSSCVHLRVEDFDDVRNMYTDSRESNALWLHFKHNMPTNAPELRGGVFAKLRRLSQNPRMAALLVVMNTEYCYDMVLKSTANNDRQSLSCEAKATHLRNYAARVVLRAQMQFKSCGAQVDVRQRDAVMWFGAAFAVACSNETQQDHPCIELLHATYGLLRDCEEPELALSPLNEGMQTNPVLTHRFAMTAAAVELGCSTTLQLDGRNDFSQMMMSYLFLHAHGAACAASLGIPLPASVRSDNALLAAGAADPLVPIKDWIRAHASNVKRVVQVELNTPVVTCSEVTSALERSAVAVLGATQLEPGILVAQLWRSETSPADVVVGVLGVDDAGTFKVTQLLLLNVKHNGRHLSWREWLEMFVTGCRERPAVIAKCVADFYEQSLKVDAKRERYEQQHNEDFRGYQRHESIDSIYARVWREAMRPLTGIKDPGWHIRHWFWDQYYNDSRVSKLFANLCNDHDVRAECAATVCSVWWQWTEMRKMGCRSRSAVIAGCVAQLTSKPWEVAMRPLTIINAVEMRGAFETVHGECGFVPAQMELFGALVNDERVEVREQRCYDLCLESYRIDGKRGFAPTLANVLHGLIKKTDGSYAMRVEEKMPSVVERGVEEFETAFRRIIADTTEKADKFERIIAEYNNIDGKSDPFAEDRSPVVERFLVVHCAPTVKNARSSVEVERPANCLTITATNAAAAFYPTGWENDHFSNATATREVIFE